MSEVMRLVGRSLAPKVVLREMLHLLSEPLGLNRGRIVLADEDAATASIRFAYGLTKAEMALGRYAAGEGITGAVLATGQPIIVQDIDAEPRFLARAVTRARLPQEIVAFIALPIEVNRRTVGVLAVHRIRHRNRLLDDDVAVLKILATLAGQLLQLRSLVEEKTRALEARNALLTRALESAGARYGIIGTSPALLQALGELERVSQASASVLLLGDSGTGKELFARAVHLASLRRDAPFIKVNCAAIPDTLFESELFGHERGAFTGANTARAGWFEQADRGTIFLDEIGELPLLMQTKLLRTLQEGTIVRLGGKREVPVNVRLVAATNRDLAIEVARGQFRRDLFFPPQRAPDPPAVAGRAPRGHPAARVALPEPHQPGEPAQRLPLAGCAGRAGGARLAGQHPRARERDRAAGAADGWHAGVEGRGRAVPAAGGGRAGARVGRHCGSGHERQATAGARVPRAAFAQRRRAAAGAGAPRRQPVSRGAIARAHTAAVRVSVAPTGEAVAVIDEFSRPVEGRQEPAADNAA